MTTVYNVFRLAKRLAENANITKTYGICYLIEDVLCKYDASDELSSNCLLFMKGNISHWDKYSGYYLYPVPHPSLHPEDAFVRLKNLWTGEYGENRMELLNFLVKEAKSYESK